MSEALYQEEDYLMISGLQHYYFCKRQWALIHIGQVWADNALTAEGNFLHAKADDPFLTETRGDLFLSRAIHVSSQRLGLSGILDVVEFRKEKTGISLPGRKGTWQPNIVEYKHGKVKKNKCDLMQLTAQVICLEEMLKCSMPTADLFYAAVNRRHTVAITAALREEAFNLSHELHQIYQLGKIPKAESYRNCTKCSLYDLCLPRLTKKQQSVARYIAKGLEENHA